MRLVRVEAGRFGKIDGRMLGDLSPGLTVVHGPNEAGKSSLMALVRHVLYGFPTRADAKEAPYLSEAGAREGRLVFADDDGEWVVERREGVHGGPVTVRTLSGRQRDGLVGELTAGVSRLAYRVVFGFGLAEMQQIEELKGKDDDLIARLYAAGAGLTVSPIDVRSKLESAMDSLWAKRASTPALNRAKARREELRVQIRTLEAETETLRIDGSRLEELERAVEAARARRNETQVTAERRSRAVADAARLTGEATSLTRDAERIEAEAAAMRDKAAAAGADEVVMASADAVDALFAELSGFRERMASLASGQSKIAAVEARLRAALGDAGWSEACALAAAADAGVAAEIDVHREALSKARARAEAAEAARERLRAEAPASASEAAGRSRPWAIPGFAVAGLGVAGLVVGLVLGQTVLAVFAGLLAAVGVVLSLITSAPSGLAAGTQASRMPAADGELAAAEAGLASAVAAWSDWVRTRGLGDGSEEPRAIEVRYQAAREARTSDGERSALRAEVGADRDRAEAYAQRVAAVIGPLLGEPAPDALLDRIPELMSRAAAKVADARTAAAVRMDALATAERLSLTAADDRDRAGASIEAAGVGLRAVGVTDADIETARVLETEARGAARDASDEFDRVSREATELRTSLGAERRESALSELRLEEETVGERIADGVRDYAILAVAARLLSLAQERYERDRQPEVVKRAEAAFAEMTNGRYGRIAVPLGKDSIEVFDVSSAATTPNKLSLGTAEELYLALRLGLIEQLGDAGRGLPVLMDDILVDFSPDRLGPAAAAIADLATRRQVVFLTCHPATADLLCRVSPSAVRLELERPR